MLDALQRHHPPNRADLWFHVHVGVDIGKVLGGLERVGRRAVDEVAARGPPRGREKVQAERAEPARPELEQDHLGEGGVGLLGAPLPLARREWRPRFRLRRGLDGAGVPRSRRLGGGQCLPRDRRAVGFRRQRLWRHHRQAQASEPGRPLRELGDPPAPGAGERPHGPFGVLVQTVVAFQQPSPHLVRARLGVQGVRLPSLLQLRCGHLMGDAHALRGVRLRPGPGAEAADDVVLADRALLAREGPRQPARSHFRAEDQSVHARDVAGLVHHDLFVFRAVRRDVVVHHQLSALLVGGQPFLSGGLAVQGQGVVRGVLQLVEHIGPRLVVHVARRPPFELVPRAARPRPV
mmetsp:Transcript_75772/g.231933  ORF Transcript_75772/g.231933 Transcript_75772/m.231933 type:complete len:349 (-) Transcript_75772:1017-2063(-)